MEINLIDFLQKVYEESEDIGIKIVRISQKFEINDMTEYYDKDINVKNIDMLVIEKMGIETISSYNWLTTYYMNGAFKNYCSKEYLFKDETEEILSKLFKEFKKEILIDEVINAINVLLIQVIQDMRYKTIKCFNDNEKAQKEKIQEKIQEKAQEKIQEKIQKEKIKRTEQLQRCKDLIIDIDKIRELRKLGSNKWKEYKSSCIVNMKKYPEVGVVRIDVLK